MKHIKGYHAHVYFDRNTIDQAKELCTKATKLFSLEMGRVHQKPVGPHPMWSCQLAFGPDGFGDVVPWIATNRNELIIFIHPETGDVVKDHTEHAIWMGKVLELDISVLT